MIDSVAAQRYARALFEIAQAVGSDQRVEEELAAFSEAVQGSEELKSFLENPRFNVEEKRKLVDKLSPKGGDAISQTLVKFYALLLQKGRFSLIHEVAMSFKRISDEAKNEAAVEIKTAVPISAEAERAVVLRLEKMTGIKITVKKEVDPSIIGGVFVRMKNKILDGSVQNKIQSLKRELVSARVI